MKKNRKYTAVLFIFIVLILTISCSEEESGEDDVACTHIPNDYGWLGNMTLTTSDPISSNGYYYDMFCVEVTAGKTYEVKFQSFNGYWVGLSIWADDGEHEIFYKNTKLDESYFETATETATAKISAWVHKDELDGGSAIYNIYIMEQP